MYLVDCSDRQVSLTIFTSGRIKSQGQSNLTAFTWCPLGGYLDVRYILEITILTIFPLRVSDLLISEGVFWITFLMESVKLEPISPFHWVYTADSNTAESHQFIHIYKIHYKYITERGALSRARSGDGLSSQWASHHESPGSGYHHHHDVHRVYTEQHGESKHR